MMIKTIDSQTLMRSDPKLYEAWHRRLIESWDDMSGTQPRSETAWRSHLMQQYGLEMAVDDGGVKPRWRLLIHDEAGVIEFVLRYS